MASRNSRIFLACEPCRRGKRKCDGVRPACTLCSRRGKDCQYSTRTSPPQRSHILRLHAELSKLQSFVRQFTTSEDPAGALPKVPPEDITRLLEQEGTQGITSMQPDQITIPAKDPVIDGVRLHSVAAKDIGNLHDRQLEALKRPDTYAAYGPSSAFSIPSLIFPSQPNPKSLSKMTTAEFAVSLGDYVLVNSLFETFYAEVNPMHRLLHVNISPCSCLETSPLNDRVLTAAILSAGSAVKHDGIENVLTDYAVNLALEALQTSCEIPVLQALTILIWRELTFGNNRSRVWMLLGAAGGISQQLGLHMLTITDDMEDNERRNISFKVQVFWSFALIDRMGVAGLGRPSTIPWRHAEVSRLRSVLLDSSLTLDDIYFDHLSELSRLHGTRMDQIYAPCFRKLEGSKKESLFLEIRQSLVDFYASIDQRLLFPPNNAKAHQGLYFLHMAYETSALILYRPFLSKSSDSLFRSILQDMALGASNSTNILFQYRKHYPMSLAPTQIIYHIIRAAVVYLLLATSPHSLVQRRSSRKLRVCFEALEDFGQKWPLPNHRAVEFLRGVASRWDVAESLPMNWSSQIVYDVDNNQLNLHDPQLEESSCAGTGSCSRVDMTGIDAAFDTNGIDFSSFDLDLFDAREFMDLQNTFDSWFLQNP